MFIPAIASFIIKYHTLFLAGTKAIFIFLLFYILFYLLKFLLIKRLLAVARLTTTKVDDRIIEIFQNIHFASLIIVAAFLAMLVLPLPLSIINFMRGLCYLVVLLELIRIIQKIIITYFELHLKSTGSVLALKIVINIILWITAFILVLSNLGINVTSLIASLGIGGLAISLALQSVFSDLFSSFSILIDKPFEIGDFIVISPEYAGTVEKIGLKTSRLRMMSGEQLVIPNSELASSKVQNFKRMERRRVLVTLGITYATSAKKIEAIPKILQAIVEAVPNTEFSRAHFTEFLDSSLGIELVYFITSREYKLFVDAKQKINLAILKTFAKQKIEFAYPTQSVYVRK